MRLLLYVFMQKLPGNTRDVNAYTQFLKDMVIPRLEAVPGVGSAQINSNGGTDEIDIVFDPMRAAQLGVQIPKMAQPDQRRRGRLGRHDRCRPAPVRARVPRPLFGRRR